MFALKEQTIQKIAMIQPSFNNGFENIEQEIQSLNATTKNNNIAELAVLILSREWPLPTKTIRLKLYREHGKTVSFQATHKALKKLVEQRILKKTELHYELNIEWLEQLNNFSIKTMQFYHTKNNSIEKN